MSFTCACGKGYTRRSSLHRHKGQCPLVLLPIRFRKRKHDTKDHGQNQQQKQQEEESSNQISSCSSSIDQSHISDQSDEDESSKETHSNTEEEADSDNNEQSDSQEEREQGRYLEEDEMFFGHDPLSPASDHSIHNESDTDEKQEHASHHPFPNMETALLYFTVEKISCFCNCFSLFQSYAAVSQQKVRCFRKFLRRKRYTTLFLGAAKHFQIWPKLQKKSMFQKCYRNRETVSTCFRNEFTLNKI